MIMGTNPPNIEQSDHQYMLSELKKINDLLQENQEKPQACILWDLENINPGEKSLFVDGLIEYVSKYGKITKSKVFGDWSNSAINKMTQVLSAKSFEMIHVHAVKKKSSADIEMITTGIETALQNPKLSMFFLITGDSDFRSLANSLKRSGKEVYIVYDSKRVSTKLLSAADDYIDYRQLIPGEEEEAKEDEIDERSIDERIKESLDLLSECVLTMETQGSKTYLSSVKVRMKVFNPSFDEKKLGFSQWSKFVERGVVEGVIKVVEKEGDALIRSVIPIQESSIPYQEIINVLIGLDEGSKPEFHLFSQVSEKLSETGFDYKKHGYNQFKKYLLDLETRNIVETKAEGLDHSVKRVIT